LPARRPGDLDLNFCATEVVQILQTNYLSGILADQGAIALAPRDHGSEFIASLLGNVFIQSAAAATASGCPRPFFRTFGEALASFLRGFVGWNKGTNHSTTTEKVSFAVGSLTSSAVNFICPYVGGAKLVILGVKFFVTKGGIKKYMGGHYSTNETRTSLACCPSSSSSTASNH
jgi:hypothetical protein